MSLNITSRAFQDGGVIPGNILVTGTISRRLGLEQCARRRRPENCGPEVLREGTGLGISAMGGPCPPSGEHRYFPHLYALDADIGLAPGVSRQEAGAAMKGHVLEEAKLMFRYKRQKPDKGD
jgi:phosphatidylethanolamine-binding protein (PEBP) family uncharacterized protein